VRILAAGAELLAAIIGSAPASAAAYLDKPVKIVVPFAPAGLTDVMARLIARKLTENLKQQFYVENHPGWRGFDGPAEAYSALSSVSSAAGTGMAVLAPRKRT
jgi:tripartite-type tricarboxylate transporter receptor subunit TctC